jgi:hypothetical protein
MEPVIALSPDRLSVCKSQQRAALLVSYLYPLDHQAVGAGHNCRQKWHEGMCAQQGHERRGQAARAEAVWRDG